jgi:hypothetical protein
VLYWGGGLQGHLGPIGLRLDVGDEIYFNNGSHHNLRVAFGPVFRFQILRLFCGQNRAASKSLPRVFF